MVIYSTTLITTEKQIMQSDDVIVSLNPEMSEAYVNDEGQVRRDLKWGPNHRGVKIGLVEKMPELYMIPD